MTKVLPECEVFPCQVTYHPGLKPNVYSEIRIIPLYTAKKAKVFRAAISN